MYILRDVPRIYPYYTRRLGGELRCFPERARDIATETETASAISTHVLLRRTVPEDEGREREREICQRETIPRDSSVRPQSSGLARGCPARITFVREIGRARDTYTRICTHTEARCCFLSGYHARSRSRAKIASGIRRSYFRIIIKASATAVLLRKVLLGGASGREGETRERRGTGRIGTERE